MKSPIPVLSGVAALALSVTAAVAAPSDDLLGYWNLDNNTNDSAPADTITDNGSWVGGSAYSAGFFGNAAQMNGSRYISIPSSADLAHPGGSITLSAWFQVDAFDTGWQALVAKGENSNYRIARRGSTNEIAYAGGTGDISGGSVNDGQWHNVVAISEAGNGMFLYLDGVQVATGGAPSLIDSGLPLMIGENPGATGRQWNGPIDDVALFDRALTQFQAEAINHFGVTHSYPMADVVQILDAHDGQSAVTIGSDTWNYEASDTGSGTFVLLAGNGSGVDVSTGPTINSFVNSPIFISSGQSATLSWQVDAPYTALSIDNGVGNVLPQTNGSGVGSISVSPSVSTVYTLSATNAIGTSVRTTTVFVGVNPSTPRINEFVADNSNDGLLDEDGGSEDWIEIYNPGPNAADLSTFHLTDDALVPDKWSFPSVIMQPDTYLMVFASSKDRALAGSELHTNFKLSAGGEYLALTQDDGAGGFTIINEYAPEYPQQEEGFSYGVGADGVTIGYFNAPTPAGVNGNAFQGFVEDTAFDFDRGFYTAPFNLSITTATVGAQIRYTTDGSEPTASTGNVYSGPINISSTTTLRAAAFKTGCQPTNVDTHTYFFVDDISTQFANGTAPAGWPSGSVNGQTFNYGMDPDITNLYGVPAIETALQEIPSVSIVTTQANLTDPSTGIYTHPGSRGRSWERPASFEIVHPDGVTPDVQSNCGIRVRGGFSRSTANPKHAFRVFFRGEYGDSKLNYPLFQGQGVDSFDKVDLRTSQNYSWAFQNDSNNTFLREVLGRDLQGSFGQPHTRSRYYHLYLNGVYWGLYMTQERAEAKFAASYLGGDEEDYDTIKSAGSSAGYTTEATDGSFAPGSDWDALWQLARAQNSSPTLARFMQMQGLNPDGSRNPSLPVYLDVDNLIDYNMIIGYTGNYDAPLSDFVGASNNWYSVRNRVRDDLGFQFFVHDGEHSMGAGGKWNGANDRMNTSNGSGSRNTYNKSNPAFIHFDVAESTEEYRVRFADQAHCALFNDGLLTTQSVLDHMEARRVIVDDVIIAESARWGDSKRTTPFNKSDWQGAVSSMTSVINSRSATFLGHLRTADLYPDLDAPIYSQHGGIVASGTTLNVTIPNDATQLYYMFGAGDSDPDDWQDDLDPRLIGGSANPAAGVLNASGGGGGVTTTVYVDSGDNWKYLDNGSNQGTAWRASGFNDASWASGPSQLGAGDSDEATTINIGPSGARFATTYFRHTVNIPNPSSFGDFLLEYTYDDGIIVYVNGTQVAIENVNPNPPFDTFANGTSADNATGSVVLGTGNFSAGLNTIAVEVHNASSGSSDLSFDLKLTGRPPGAGGGVTLALPTTITSPTWIKSRSYNSTTGEWSALNKAYFVLAPPAGPGDLVISEVHYHPLDPTAAELAADPSIDDKDDFEFVEIMNISSGPLDLGGAGFRLVQAGDHLEGIDVTFPLGTTIQPGERMVVVANTAAMMARYPSLPASKIIGDYGERLDNTGEWITLVAADGSVIQSFRYNDVLPWPEDPDGAGPAMILQDPASDPDHSDPTSWIPSPTTGGSPGDSDGNPFLGNPLDDLDCDGAVAIVEYVLGTSDTVPSAELLPQVGVTNIGGTAYLTITYRQDPLATDATPFIEGSADLNTWFDADIAGITAFVGSGTDTDGTPTHTWRFTAPIPGSAMQFIRLGVSY